jgi:hypothetical protein
MKFSIMLKSYGKLENFNSSIFQEEPRLGEEKKRPYRTLTIYIIIIII